ncbi:substrate-binding domain-containing protein [Streptomyces sp. NPDC088747]|uniref:substrate-binding domain-containing protein n=1 Tax=Streptomyces sp. NPDC088747 TaxID=3365886 RepID=UPI00380DF743
MNVKSYAKVGAAFGAAALGLGILAAPASADPATATDYRILSAIGSDTTQYVMNGLANGTGVVNSGGAKIISSWDAVQPATGADPFVTKPGCSYTRAEANGSTNGINRLSDDISNGGSTCVDIARSSRGPKTTVPGTDLTFVPYARDAVTYATDLGSTVPTNLTIAQLASIYKTCAYTDAGGVSRTVQPLLPQAGSGTRTYFLTSIGVTEAQITTAKATCGLQDNVQEHDGTAIANANQLVPYSVAQWIAQGKGLADVPNRKGESRLRSIAGSVPTTGSGTSLALNPGFIFSRDVYNVVQTTRLSEAAISEALTDICAASATIQNYGFGTISNCGDTTTPALKGGLYS